MKGHPRLWVIRCSGPVGQHQLPDPAPSIPSTESTREQDLSDDLFHEPEAQPKSVTAEALSRDHPTWPPAQHERLPVVIQARQPSGIVVPRRPAFDVGDNLIDVAVSGVLERRSGERGGTCVRLVCPGSGRWGAGEMESAVAPKPRCTGL